VQCQACKATREPVAVGRIAEVARRGRIVVREPIEVGRVRIHVNPSLLGAVDRTEPEAARRGRIVIRTYRGRAYWEVPICEPVAGRRTPVVARKPAAVVGWCGLDFRECIWIAVRFTCSRECVGFWGELREARMCRELPRRSWTVGRGVGR